MRLQDKVAIVTGSSSGIGEAIVKRFAAEGAKVAINYLPGGPHEKEGIDLAAALGPSAMTAPGDISKRADVERMIGAVISKFGRLDIAVNNAGMEIKKPFLDVTDDEWNKVIA